MNPGFEQHYGNCTPFIFSTYGFGEPCNLSNWFALSQSPDAYSTGLLSIATFHLPNPGNAFSKHIYPHSDSCCVGAAEFAPYNPATGGGGVNCRSLLEGQLIKPLINGHHYAFSIWLHLFDTLYCNNTDRGKIVGINSFSALFSDTVFNYQVNVPIQNYTPQVQINQMLADTGNWVQLKDTFLCEGGGEQYIILGNFKPDGQFQWQLVDSICNQPIYSHYFMDDVSLIDLDSTTGIEGISNNSGLEVYPNPASNEIDIVYKDLPNSVSTIKLINSIGVVVSEKKVNTVSGNLTFDVSKLVEGVYLVVIDGYPVVNKKITIIHH